MKNKYWFILKFSASKSNKKHLNNYIAKIRQVKISTVNQFGFRIKHLREQTGLLQRQVANQLDIDTPMLSKIERGERNAKRKHIITLSKIFNISEDELLTLWLADQLCDVVKGEDLALKAMNAAQQSIKSMKKLNINK